MLLAKPWSKPASAYAIFTILKESKAEIANQHKRQLQSLENHQNLATIPLILIYTDGSKIGEDVAAGYCQIAEGKYIQAKNISLG